MDAVISRFDQALNEQKKPLFIFDIDSTIFNVSPRNQAILDLFCRLHSKKYPSLLKYSSMVKLGPEDWGLRPFTHLVQENEIVLKEMAMSFWRTHFFSGTFLESDIPYNGALNFIKFLSGKGSEILYLTGRDDHRMRQGTLEQLKHHKLPLKKDSDLITKPHKSHLDGEYKSGVIQKILDQNKDRQVFFIDNEPAVIKHCLFPENKNYNLIFIDSAHSKREEPSLDWLTIHYKSYVKVLEALK